MQTGSIKIAKLSLQIFSLFQLDVIRCKHGFVCRWHVPYKNNLTHLSNSKQRCTK